MIGRVASHRRFWEGEDSRRLAWRLWLFVHIMYLVALQSDHCIHPVGIQLSPFQRGVRLITAASVAWAVHRGDGAS